MTRTQIQAQLEVIKQLPAYDGSISFVSSQLSTWLTAQEVTDANRDKILDDLLSYAY
jgi:hypothetical protein